MGSRATAYRVDINKLGVQEKTEVHTWHTKVPGSTAFDNTTSSCCVRYVVSRSR